MIVNTAHPCVLQWVCKDSGVGTRAWFVTGQQCSYSSNTAGASDHKIWTDILYHWKPCHCGFKAHFGINGQLFSAPFYCMSDLLLGWAPQHHLCGERLPSADLYIFASKLDYNPLWIGLQKRGYTWGSMVIQCSSLYFRFKVRAYIPSRHVTQ